MQVVKKVAFFTTKTFSAQNINEALKKADILPKSSFNKYAVAAIAKTTPCLKNW